MAELRLNEIWIYPIKSIGGIRLNRSKVQDKGLEFDRRMMLVDSDNQFITQRRVNKLALFKPSITDGKVTVSFEGEMLAIDNTTAGEMLNAVIWDDTVQVFEINKKYSAWFSERLGSSCRLVSFPEQNPRPVSQSRAINNEQVSLADGYPFLIIGQSTLDFLNSKLEDHLPMNRFRPNLVFTGGTPHEEDTWREFTIGNNKFCGVKPCARCVIPTINQQTAEKGHEPTKTLATYRRFNNEVYFGQNVLALNHEEIHEGDIITVESYSEDEIVNTLKKNLLA